MPPSHSRQTRRTWLLIFGSFILLVVLLGAICFGVEQRTPPRIINASQVAQLRPPIIVTVLIALVGAVVWLRWRVDGKIGDGERDRLMSPQQFMTDSIVALSLTNFCAIFGFEFFFLGASFREFLLFALGKFCVDFACVLPRGLQFWTAHESRSSV